MATNIIKVLQMYSEESKAKLQIQELNSNDTMLITYEDDNELTFSMFELSIDDILSLHDFLSSQVELIQNLKPNGE